jgi:starch synthase (maltosyl-transferring)
VDGFRCDAAYQVPSKVWKELINYTKSIDPSALFWAETLGAKLDDYEKLSEAHFDFFASSSKYWDFTQPWCPMQYNSFREYADSISFPESHDTSRLAKDTKGRKDVQIFRYLFASLFSAGVMLPQGYEYGYQKQLHVVHTKPEDRETPTFDITSNITLINSFKQSYQTLNEDGLITHFPFPNTNLLLLRKENRDQKEAIFLLYNKNWHEAQEYTIDVGIFLEKKGKIFELNLNGSKNFLADSVIQSYLPPNQFRLFYQKTI